MNSTYNWKYRQYLNGRKSSAEFSEVVPNVVRVRTDKSMVESITGKSTPFDEVKLAPFSIQPELRGFLKNGFITYRDYNFIWNEIKQSIFENWMVDKIHVVGASSGYDSRLIAKALQELTIKHGQDWLGETYFIECAGEPEGFLEVMKKLGWEKNALVWIPDFSFEYFKDLHKRFNGLCAYPMNQWYDYYLKNWNEDEIQYISGYGGNVVDAMFNPAFGHTKKERLIGYFKKQYYYQLSAFRQPKYSFHPFWSWRYINATLGMKYPDRRMAQFMCDTFVPECRNIPRMRILGEVTANGHRTVSDKVMNKLIEWYQSTEYGKRHPSKTTNTIEYHIWWLNLCIASYVQESNISIH